MVPLFHVRCFGPTLFHETATEFKSFTAISNALESGLRTCTLAEPRFWSRSKKVDSDLQTNDPNPDGEKIHLNKQFSETIFETSRNSDFQSLLSIVPENWHNGCIVG